MHPIQSVMPKPSTSMRSRRKHIAFFLSGLTGGGVPHMTLNLANGFVKRNFKVDIVVASPKGQLRYADASNTHVIFLNGLLPPPGGFFKDRKLQILSTLPALAGYLKSTGPDALIAADHWVNLCAVLAKSIAGFKGPVAVSQRTLFSTHTADKPVLRFLVRCLYPKANAIIAVSQGVAVDLARATAVDARRISTIYNPVITPEFSIKAREAVAHEWFSANNVPIVLSAGRLTDVKDFPTLIRAFAELRKTEAARLVVLGSGKELARLQNMAKHLGVAKDVLFPGFVANPIAFMSKASVFVLSSKWEGLPAALIEAMACGCPVVSTNCPGGVSEILENGKHGILVPVGDHLAMADAIRRQLHTAADKEPLMKRATRFSIENAIDQYLAVLY